MQEKKKSLGRGGDFGIEEGGEVHGFSFYTKLKNYLIAAHICSTMLCVLIFELSNIISSSTA